MTPIDNKSTLVQVVALHQAVATFANMDQL